MEQEKVMEATESETPQVELTQVEKLNNLRKKYRNADLLWKVITVAVILLALVFIYLIYMKLLFDDGLLRVILACVFLLAIPFCLYVLPLLLKMSSKYKAYNTEYKNVFLQEKILGEFPKADYKAKDRISIKEISECSMIRKARSANANDCIEGTYKGVDFLRYDMELSYKKSGRTSNCVLIACANRTELDSEVQIIQRDFKIGKQLYEKPETYQEYVCDDEKFNKDYAVYAVNQETATGFVDNELTRKLRKFSGGGPIAAFFDKKKVYLIIKRKKDAMEAPVYKAVRENACRREAEKEIEVIKNWVDLLYDCVVK
ncbi:MAG: DUF3137 domain-containing protein [Lachnospiraceae bacterium]|nr:DUF3137 domain-containing protein [Lachnospiraceae bacterium]